MRSLQSFVLVAMVLSISTLSFADAVGFAGKTPQKLCAYMRDMGIPGSATYRDQGEGNWSCGSSRKKLLHGEPAAVSDLQYRVLGNESVARKQILELRMRSYRAPQGVLNVFSLYVDVMLEKTLGINLSAEMYKNIMSAIPGTWERQGHRLSLQKLRSKGSSYDLRFNVESSVAAAP